MVSHVIIFIRDFLSKALADILPMLALSQIIKWSKKLLVKKTLYQFQLGSPKSLSESATCGHNKCADHIGYLFESGIIPNRTS